MQGNKPVIGYDTVDAMMEAGDLDGLKDLFSSVAVKDCSLNLTRMAANHPSLDIMKYVVEDLGADPYDSDGFVTQFAAMNGHVDVLKYLIEECGIDITGEDDRTLCWAADGGHIPVMEYLILQGADVETLAVYMEEWTDHGEGAARNAYWMQKKDPEAYDWYEELQENPNMVFEKFTEYVAAERAAELTAQKTKITSSQRALRRYVGARRVP